MKKFIAAIILVAMILVLCGCGNVSYGLGNYTFKHIHVCDFSGSCADLTVKTWHDNEVGIEVKTEEAGPLFLSEGTYILFDDKCPICDFQNP